MKQIRIQPAALRGSLRLPPSKSDAHRALICAALARGVSVIQPIEYSEDILATIRCLRQLGARIDCQGETVTVDGSGTFSPTFMEADCGESGSTLRFLIPIAAAGGVAARFVGHGNLPHRPIGIYLSALPEKGVRCDTAGGLPLTISGQLQSGDYFISGDVSSQFITGLLFALPLLSGDSRIHLTSPACSVGYIQMTLDRMRDFGVQVQILPDGWFVPGNQSYRPHGCQVEGDWSQAAFFLTAAALGGHITIDNLNPRSSQGDKACVEVYRALGASVVWEKERLIISPGDLHGIELSAQDIPDMVPAFAAAAMAAKGKTIITGAERLRIKECDRISAMREGICRLGGKAEETPDGLVIEGVPALRGGLVQGFHDHRIVMSFACAANACREDVLISDPDSVNKSFPSFFEVYRRLGGMADVIMGPAD